MENQNPDIRIHPDHEKLESQHGDVNVSGKMLNEDAKQATALEHSTTLWQGLKTYRKAAFWSVLVSSSIISEWPQELEKLKLTLIQWRDMTQHSSGVSLATQPSERSTGRSTLNQQDINSPASGKLASQTSKQWAISSVLWPMDTTPTNMVTVRS